MRKIVGVTVGTPLSADTIKKKLNPVLSVNGVRPDESGNIDVGVGNNFTTDETLSFKDGVLSVNTANSAEADNTLPITSAAVATQVGNIEILLKTI